MDYKNSGVNIEEGYKAVEKYRDLAASTSNRAVLNGIGSFAGMFSLNEFSKILLETNHAPMDDPVLVSGTDGVGTKLDVAFRLKKYDTVGIDCVAMCVNDILCHGARPLFFLDYLVCGKLDAAIAAGLVKGVAAGCRETGAVLLGGETAEHPGVMPEDQYDLAGFAVGIADRKKIINGSKIREGDTLLGIASSGVHSNGFSLIRKVITDLNEDFGGMPIGRVLLEPTRLYVKPVLELMEQVEIKGMAHITGGGFYENIPRVFPSESSPLAAVIKDPLGSGYKGGWKIPPIFHRIAYGIKNMPGQSDAAKPLPAAAQKAGEEILRTDPGIKKLMFNTFNMGIGLVLALDPADVQTARTLLEQKGFPSWEIGRAEKTSHQGAADNIYGELRFE
ncbi:MAG: phosphoribosylformylglycinamidine cyclo-ligase [Treponema sp.]|nr:phosphoribosylformylglycinamidine cyclo-ligase [Treponema sp.]